MTTPASSARAVTMPDKPSIDGLEDKWAQVWAEQGTYPSTASRTPRARGLLDRHSAADGERARCTSATCSPTPTPTAWPATSGWPASRSSTRSAGTTTACRPSAASRTTTACAATPRCPTSRASSRRSRAATARASRPPTSSRSAARTSSSCATMLTVEDEKAFEALFRTAGLRPRLGHQLPHHRRPLAGDGAAGVPAQPRAAARPTRRRRPGLWDVTFQTAVAQAELEARDYPGAYHRVAFHGPAGSDARGPHRDHPPRAASRPWWRSSPTPTTSGTPRCSAPRSPRRCSGSRCRSSPTTAAEPDKGAGIAMCCTFGDLTDVHVVARAAAADPLGHHPRRPDLSARPPSGSPPGRASALFAELAGKTTFSAREAVVARAARVRRPRRRADRRPSARRTSTRRATSRSRSSPRASGTSATAAATPSCAPS